MKKCFFCGGEIFEGDESLGERDRTKAVSIGSESGEAHEDCVSQARSAYETPAWWLRANGINTAAFTGTDHRCVRALAAVWEVYAYTRSPHSLDAARHLLAVMQPQTRELTKKLIAKAMDWSDVDQLWPLADSIAASESARRTTPRKRK